MNVNGAAIYPSLTQPPSAAPHLKALSKWCLNETMIDAQIRWRGAVVVAVVGVPCYAETRGQLLILKREEGGDHLLEGPAVVRPLKPVLSINK